MEKQTLEEYTQKRTDALDAFRNFLKECSKKKFTMQQFLMIGTFAEEEIKKIVAKEGHMDKGSIEGLTRKIAKKAGVERANPHKFRRTCATMALRRGMPIEQVSKMLGHAELSTTQIYLDLSEDDLREAHKKYVL